MSEMSDEKLEQMLRERRVAPPSADLAERIILKAQVIPQSQALSLGQSIRRLFADFQLPKPSYVLAGTLIIGFVLGFSDPFDKVPTDRGGSTSAQAFLYVEEDTL
ncbi:MAG TPA: hypothetical protein VI231_09685 [Candidatus Binatia bacterium]|jgi:hypothetical protein